MSARLRRELPRARVAGMALVAVYGVLAGGARPAHAQASEGAVAEALFRSARALVAAGDYAHACPKFAESHRLDPKLGTLMNLALCHEKEGKTASAWAEYTAAAELAGRAGQSEREHVARTSAAAMEKVLSHLVLRPATHDAIVVTLDGQMMGAATLGTPLPVDPGAHQVTASADGRRAFAQSITVAAGATDQTITIPALELLPPSATPIAVVHPTIGAAPASAPATVAVPYGHPLLGYGLIGGGAAALIVGGVFGGIAFSKKSAAEGECGAVFCTPAGLSDISSMRSAEAVSTIGVAVGVAAAGAGLYFIIRSGKHMEAAPGVASAALASSPSPIARIAPMTGPGQGGLSLSGTF
jgi:hypothetical protein